MPEIVESECGIAGVVFCGGQSRRMGAPKALLEFAGEPLLVRTVRIVSSVVQPVFVSARPDQPLPPLPAGVAVLYDSVIDGGPLPALRDVMAVAAPTCEWLIALACDMPNLTAEFLRSLVDARRDEDAVIPFAGERWHPLSALYRRSVMPVVERLMADGQKSMHDLVEAIRVRPLDSPAHLLRNVNTPDELDAALRDWHARRTLTPP